MKPKKENIASLTRKLYESNFPFFYDVLYNKEERFKRESPFYKKIVKRRKIKSILDVGCGNGFHLILFNKLPGIKKLVGIDNSEKMLKLAHKNLLRENLKEVILLKKDIRDMDNNDIKFDLITCIYSLSALPSNQQVQVSLSKFKKLLTPRGILLIEDTNGDRIINQNPTVECRSMDAEEMRLFKRFNIEVTVCKKLNPLIQIGKNVNGGLKVTIGSGAIFKFLQSKNLYFKVYHNLDPWLVNDHIFLSQGLIKRRQLESFRTVCCLLPRRKLEEFLKKAGFQKIQFYSNHNFAPFTRDSDIQIVMARN